MLRPCLCAALLAAPLAAQDVRPEILSFTHAPASPVPADAPVQFTVTARHPEGARLEYSFEFDDGTPRTPWDTLASRPHAYARPGLYAVRVRVQDPARFESVRILRLVVVKGPGAYPARSTPIALDSVRRRLWVANPDHNSVSVLDPDQPKLLREIPVGRQPMGLALDAQGRAWVACRRGDDLHLVASDGATLSPIDLPYGSAPAGIVLTSTHAYVSLEGSGRVARIDLSSRAVTGTLPVGPSPRALALTPDGKTLLVSRFLSGDSAGAVYAVDLAGFTAAASIALPIDRTSSESGTAARGLPNYVAALAVHPDGAAAWYAAKKDNILRGLARDNLPLTFESTLRSLLGRIDLSAGGASEAASARIDIDNTSQPSALAFSSHGTFLFAAYQGGNRIFVLDAATRHVLLQRETGAAPQGIAVDGASGRVFVQDFLGRTVTVFDARDLLARGDTAMTRLTAVSVSSKEPLQEAVLRGKRLFYHAGDPRMSLDGYTSCAACHLDGAHDGRTWDFTDRGEGLRNTTTLQGKAGTGHGPLHWSANFDEMQDFEHDIRGPFGGKGFLPDALFAAGARNAPLGDAKAGHSPDLDDLAAYVASLAEVRRSPHRSASGALTPSALEGGKVFHREDVGCAKCHVPPLFTDSRLPGAQKPAAGPVTVFAGAESRVTAEGFLLHDVGTLKAKSGKRLGGELPGLDTPTLEGIWETAPYLHDGSAATVLDVLTTANAGDRHGKTSHLSASEIAALGDFLLQIDGTPSTGLGIPAPKADKARFRAILRRLRGHGILAGEARDLNGRSVPASPR